MLGLAPSYAVLCFVQGALVLAQPRELRLVRNRVLGLAVPAVALLLGVGIIRGFGEGGESLTWLAASATPILAALCGWAQGWRPRWLAVPLAAALYWVAWWAHSAFLREIAGVLLIAGSCLTLAALIAALTTPEALAAGLVLLVGLDVVLVWGTPQIGPASTELHDVVLPTLLGRPVPQLQDVTFQAVTMGWLDLLAPALLAAVLPRRRAVVLAAAGATAAAALVWGLLLFLTSPIPATVPVLAGLAVAYATTLPWKGPCRRHAPHWVEGL